MKDWKQYIYLHGFITGVVEPAFWRHTSVYILEDNRTMGLLTQLFDVTPLHSEKKWFFFLDPEFSKTKFPQLIQAKIQMCADLETNLSSSKL